MDLKKAAAQKWAIELLAALNHDNNRNYPYTLKQLEVLSDNVEDLQAQGVVFDDSIVEVIIGGPDHAEDLGVSYDPYIDLGELLDDIFNGVDENGVGIIEAPAAEALRNPFHFNAKPYPVGSKRPW